VERLPNEIEKWKKGASEEIAEEKDAKIIFDGRQYTIKIPIDFAEAMDFNLQKDRFKFTLIIPPIDSKKKPELKGEVVNV